MEPFHDEALRAELPPDIGLSDTQIRKLAALIIGGVVALLTGCWFVVELLAS